MITNPNSAVRQNPRRLPRHPVRPPHIHPPVRARNFTPCETRSAGAPTRPKGDEAETEASRVLQQIPHPKSAAEESAEEEKATTTPRRRSPPSRPMSASAPSPPAGAAPDAAPVPFYYCHGCDATVSVPAPEPSRLLCPRCRGEFLEEEEEENPSPFSAASPPPPPPGFLSGSGSSSSDEADDDLGLGMDPAAAREYLSRLINHRLYDEPIDVAAAAAAAVSVLHHGHRAGGEPPAPAASIAALPTVEVSDPAAACAICKDDLPLASAARRLPCAHLYHSCCIVTWLEMHNSCPVCRFRIPSSHPEEASPSDQDPPPTRITIRFTTTSRRRARARSGGAVVAPVSASPTQLAQAVTGEGGGGPANSGETVSSEWPPHPESDTVMSEAREGDGFFD
ncbi:hypothetical protein ACP70R_001007 [Stipagrostis hirtigluma subsp. patula]